MEIRWALLDFNAHKNIPYCKKYRSGCVGLLVCLVKRRLILLDVLRRAFLSNIFLELQI